MVQAVRGVLLQMDAAIKQIILEINDQSPQPFILEDLDDEHVFVQEESVDLVRAKLDEILEKNTYKVDEE
ncbi:nucleotide excision repair, TFIIH, subunit [Caulochytrium protostelioides]|uniref:General transcription and DNA repair factor IIH subunit TFB5 n=1 Tax=Caulochytrium protostelioides TaxID=1555241 RepID=A0A4P9WW91_9FUNG|nr:nucleotide excision repair, TFIIH, subunit [Caulochytrium protostelioides]